MLTHSPSPANPFRPVDWRYQRAKWLVQQKKRTRGESDDSFTKTARRYVSMKAKCKEDCDFIELEHTFPGLFWAEQIYSNKVRETRWAIEARLLANEKLDNIADKVSTTPETVLWYERVFFNVLPHLRKLDYIACVAIGGSIHAGLHEREYDILWKLLGYAYGPIMLDSVIMPLTGSIHIDSADQVEATWEDVYLNNLTKKAGISAMTVPTAYNQCNIMQLYNDIKRIEKEAGGGSLAFSSISSNVYATLSQLPFFSGDTKIDGRPAMTSPALPFYDAQGAELRANELVNVALGNDTSELREVANMKIPEAIHVPSNAT